MAAILISVDDINFENLSCNKRGVHIWGDGRNPNTTRRMRWGSQAHPNLRPYSLSLINYNSCIFSSPLQN